MNQPFRYWMRLGSNYLPTRQCSWEQQPYHDTLWNIWDTACCKFYQSPNSKGQRESREENSSPKCIINIKGLECFFIIRSLTPKDKHSQIKVPVSHAWCLSEFQSIYMISFPLKLILKCDPNPNQDSMFPNSMEFCVIFPLDIKWIGSKFKTSPNCPKMEHPENVQW